MTGFTDVHAHFLYGIDDGPQTAREMEQMLDAAYADQVRALFATPHITPGLEPFDMELYQTRLDQARAYCAARGYDMKIYGGAEIMYNPAMANAVINRTLVTLAQSDYLLTELLPDVSFSELRDAVWQIERAGYVCVLAHIERYACLYHPRIYELKKRHDIRYQINCASVVGSRGFLRDRFIKKWFEDGLIDFVASDAHNCSTRPTRMSAAYKLLKQRYGAPYAGKLTGLSDQ